MALTSFSHHDLVLVFGILGNIVSFGVFLSPLPTFWRIYKKKSTEGFQSIPYSVALFSAMLMLYYAFLKENNATLIITINSFGCLIEAFYLAVYLLYAPKKARVFTAKLMGLFNVTFLGLIIFTTMTFAHGADQRKLLSKGGIRETTVGWTCAVFSVCVFAAPLSVMRMVIRTKSVEFMPFMLSFSLTLCAVMWFFYGFLIKDFYVALPNVLGFLFGITQMILYIIYKDSSKKQKLVINDADIKQLQAELAADIKLAKIERIEDDEIVTPKVVEIIVDVAELKEKPEKEADNNENILVKVQEQVNTTTLGVNGNNVIMVDGEAANPDLPRGVFNV